MTQPLFISAPSYEDDSYEKNASEVSLPESPNTWPQDILQELYKQVPFISDFEPNVVMDRVDAERGYAFGHVEVMNRTEMQHGASEAALGAAGVRVVRIPVIVKNRKLQPFDMIVTADSKMLPLNERRLKQAIFRPQPFDITSRTPGDQSLIGMLYPPFRQNYGMGGGGGGTVMSPGMGKEGAANCVPNATKPAGVGPHIKDQVPKLGSVLAAISHTLNEHDYTKFASQLSDPQLQAAFEKNSAATKPALQKLAKASPSMASKTASVLPFVTKPTVVQIVKEASGYSIKTANHRVWAPITRDMDRGELVRCFGEKVAAAVDLSGAATFAEGANSKEQAAPAAPELVKDFGFYQVKDSQGRELVGFVIPNLIDTAGSILPISLFTNGSQAALQAEIVGVPTGSTTGLPEGHPRGHGAFYKHDGKSVLCTVPIDVSAGLQGPGGVSMMATSFDGKQFKIEISPHLEMPLMEGDSFLVPSDWSWLPLGSAENVVLASQPGEFDKTAAIKHLGSVTVRGDGESFSFTGFPVEKIAASQREFLSLDESLFLLGGLGVDPQESMKKIGEAVYWSKPVSIPVGREIKLASAFRKEATDRARSFVESLPSLKRDLVKEAAFIPDPMSVDTVLSLGFINPENMTTFISHMPVLDDSQSRMCELLLAARLGMQDIPTGPLEKAIKMTEEVLDGLRVVAFQKN